MDMQTLADMPSRTGQTLQRMMRLPDFVMSPLRRRLSLSPADARVMVERVFRDHPTQNFAVRLWDDFEIRWSATRDFTLTFTDAETFRACMASASPAQFAEAYVDARLRIDGDLWKATELATFLRDVDIDTRDKLRFAPKLAIPASSHTVRRDQRDVQAHYDLSDEFFQLFLDERMVYSCAYFAHSDQSLEEAQARKLDMICRKLDLQPGEHLLDVGCGWGAMLIWAARHYDVHAYGITLSENQAKEVRRRAKQAGVDDRVSVDLRHYAELPSDRYDKISSVGMYEHVGVEMLPAYLAAMHRALRPGGLFLNHGITVPTAQCDRTGGAFIFRNVFPGADLAPVPLIQQHMEELGFEILDVQGMRPHYALTLREWFRRFQAHRDQAARLVPERTLRTWDLYLAGCARAFDDGVTGLHQVLAGKPGRDGRVAVPLTREQIGLPEASPSA